MVRPGTRWLGIAALLLVSRRSKVLLLLQVLLQVLVSGVRALLLL